MWASPGTGPQRDENQARWRDGTGQSASGSDSSLKREELLCVTVLKILAVDFVVGSLWGREILRSSGLWGRAIVQPFV